MATSVILPSFSGGELSTSLYARVDLDKYHSGAATLRNFYVDYRGGVANRPGTKFIDACASDSTARLIPFIVSRDQSYILELTDEQIRVFLRGVLVDTVSTPYAEADIFGIKFTQSADVMTLTHPSYTPYNLNRTDATTFNLTEVTFSAGIDAPGQPSCTATVPGAALSYCYCVTALSKTGQESIASHPTEIGSAVLDPTAATPVVINMNWSASTDAVAYNVYKAGPVPANAAMPTVYGYIGQSKIAYFTDNNIGPDFAVVPPEHRDPFSPGQITSIDVTSGGTGATDDYEPITITGDGTGAVAFMLVQGVTNIGVGVVVQNGGINYTAATAAPATGSAALDVNIDLNNYYPSCTTYYQQRKVYAGSEIAPLRVDMSKTGEFANFDVSPAVLDSDAISVNLTSQQVNRIQHMIPMSTGLVVFTTGNAFLVTGGGNSSSITPSNVAATPQASTGSGNLAPIVVNYNILFQQYEGNVIRDMTFQWTTNSYSGTDRSMLANHLFNGFTLNDWGFAVEPYHLLHAVRDDGKMLVMAYVPEQEVYGWAQWDTQGLFKSVAVIPEDGASAVYVVVQRHIATVDGACWKNYIERFADREGCCIYDAWFLDSALSLPETTIDTVLYPSAGTGDITLTTYDPCEALPTEPGPFTLGFVMEAKENYDAAAAAELLAGTQSPAFALDQTKIATSFDFDNRLLTYLGLIVSNAVYPAKTYTNTTGYTLWDGSGNIYAPGATMNASFSNSKFSPQVIQKNIATGAVVSYPTYSAAATVPAEVGVTRPYVSAHGTGYTTAAVSITGGGGSGMQAVAILDAGGGGYVVNVTITDWGSGYTSAPAFAITGDGAGATVGHSAYNTPSDGTYRWVGSSFCTDQILSNGPNAINPYNGDFWTVAQSCELYQFRQADDFAQVIGPFNFALSSGTFTDPVPYPAGFDATWCYALTVPADGGVSNHHDLVLVPSTIQAAETTAATKLGYVIWDTAPFKSDFGSRLTFGTDGKVYILSLGDNGSGKFYWRLTKFTPPVLGTFGANAAGTMTDMTASLWNTGGPNTNAANYTLSYFNNIPRSLLTALCRLPATDQLVAILKMPKEANAASTDYTKTLFSCVYVTLGGSPSYDHHAGFVTGYMNNSWVSVGSIPVTGWAVMDCREHDNFLEQSDYIYSGVDYTRRWFVFQCYPISSSAVDTSNGLMDVLVEYEFVSGSAPAVVTPPSPLSDPSWDVEYTAYQTAISQEFVVYNSTLLGTVPQKSYPFRFNSGMVFPDPGLSPVATRDGSFWYSGQTAPEDSGSVDGDAMFYLDAAFTYRADYNTGPNGHYGPISPPFLRLTYGTPNIAVGDVINTACGKIQVETIESSTTITGTVLQPWDDATLPDDSSTPIPIPAGTWSLVTPAETFSGLDHLEGKTVWGLADGKVVGPLTVTSGIVDLGFEASSAVVGLQYTSQFQTLRLDTGEPTIQGRRKIIQSLQLRMACSVGFTVGTTDFSTLYQPKTNYPDFAGGPAAYTAYTQGGAAAIPFSGDVLVNVEAGWERNGVITVKQELPLPVSILGIIPEVTLGDTQR